MACDCFGYASASRRPVKRYNLLVPDVFPKKEPPLDRPVDATTERKFKRLFEYLQKTPSRGPKVSRRLARRMNKDLRARRYAFVRLEGQAYIYLLTRLSVQDSNLFARELVCQQVDWDKSHRHRRDYDAPHFHSVVGTLLQHPLAELRTSGAQVLGQFMAVQTTSAYMEQIQEFVPLLCQSAALKPHGVKDMQGSSPSQAAIAALQSASIRCMQAYLQLCTRVAAVSPYLQQIEKHVLDLLQPSDALPVSTTQGGKAPSQDAPSSAVRTDSSSSAGAAPPPGLPLDEPAAAAGDAWHQLADMSRDAAEGRRVLDFLLAYLDEKGSWTARDGRLDATLGRLRKAGGDQHQRYLLFCALLKHAGTAELPPAVRLAVLEQAEAEGSGLEPPLAFPALVAALKELPQHVLQSSSVPPSGASGTASPADQTPRPDAQSAQGQGSVWAAASSVVGSLASRVNDPCHIAEVLGGMCAALPGRQDVACATLELCISAAAAAAACHQERGRPGVPLPHMLLQDVAFQQLQGSLPKVQMLSQTLLRTLLPIVLPQGLREPQATAILSACWHQSQDLDAADEAQVRKLSQLLKAVPQHSSPEALLPALRLAAMYHAQALPPSGAATPPPSSPQAPAAAHSSKPGLVGAAVHAVGSILHSARATHPAPSPPASPSSLAQSRSELPEPPLSGNGAVSAREDGSSGGPLHEAAPGLEPAPQNDSQNGVRSALLANGHAGDAAPHPGGKLGSESAAGAVGGRLKAQHSLAAVRLHDALVLGIAGRVSELAPDRKCAWSVPSAATPQRSSPPEQVLQAWLSHEAFTAREAWLQPVTQGLAAAGCCGGTVQGVKAALQQPFNPLAPSALLPRAKVRSTRETADRPESDAAALRQRLAGTSGPGSSQASQATPSRRLLPSMQELLQDWVPAGQGQEPADAGPTAADSSVGTSSPTRATLADTVSSAQPADPSRQPQLPASALRDALNALDAAPDRFTGAGAGGRHSAPQKDVLPAPFSILCLPQV